MAQSSKSEKERKRRVVARGLARGKSPKAIAKLAGCKTRHVQKLAKEPETTFLVREIMRPHYARLSRLVPKAITAVEGGLTAKTRSGTAIHEMRLRAVGRFGQLMRMAEGQEPADPSTHGQVTWEEFVVLYHRRVGNAGDTPVEAAVV